MKKNLAVLIFIGLIFINTGFVFSAFTAVSRITNNNFRTGEWSTSNPPVLILPENESSTNLPVYFEWSHSPENYGLPLTSALEIYDVDPRIFPLSVPYIFQSNISETRYPESTTISFPDGNYFWRVKSVNSFGVESLWSELWEFKIDGTPPATTVSVENSPLKQMDEQIFDGTFEKYESIDLLSPDFSVNGQFDLINNVEEAYEGQKMILLGAKNPDEDIGKDINENNITYNFNNNSKTISFYYNFLSEDEYPFDSPGFIFKINNKEIFHTDTFESTGWRQFMYDISSFDGATTLDFFGGNTDDLYRQSYVYIDKISTGMTAVNSHARFHLESNDNSTSEELIQKYYCVDDCDDNNPNWILYSLPFNLGLTEGEHVLYFYGVDDLGNKETPKAKLIFFDDSLPQKISDLRIKNIATNSASLIFSASANNSATSSGKVAGYNVKISEEYIDSASDSAFLNDWWSHAANIDFNIIPEDPGILQEFYVYNLLADKNYFVALKSYDAAENFSEISNVVNILISGTPTPTVTPSLSPTPISPTPSTAPSLTPTPTSAPTNLIQNSSFETDSISPWVNDGITSSISLPENHSGYKSVLLTTDATGYTKYLKQRIVGINPAKKYKVIGFVKSASSDLNFAEIRVAFYESGGTTQLQTPNQSNESNLMSWTLLETGEISPPATAAEMEVRLALKKNSGTTSAAAYFDDIFVEEINP